MRVGIGILAVNGRVLIGHRPAGVRLGGYWEFPGGKVELGETPEHCVQRELHEELGLDVVIDRPLTPIVSAQADLTVELLPYLCRWTPDASLEPSPPDTTSWPDVQPRVNTQVRWVTPAELHTYRFPKANARLLREVQSLLA